MLNSFYPVILSNNIEVTGNFRLYNIYGGGKRNKKIA